jgi:hypothetical protein
MVVETIDEMLTESGADSVKVDKVADRMDSTAAVVMTLLNTHDQDARVVDGDRGELWLTGEPMEAPKPRVKASRTPKPAITVQTAATPVVGSDGANVTVSVSEDSTERREIDANEGERVIGEYDMNALIQSLRAPAVMAVTEYESDIEKNGLALSEPDFVPAMTDEALNSGVSENAWYMAHASLTQTARDWWTKYVARKVAENAPPAMVEIPSVPVYAVAPATAVETGF